MKEKYKNLKAGILMLMMVSGGLTAQISGVVTVNSAAATGGTNYQTFTALATALNTSGVSGPLTVNVVAGSGPYNEQVNFNQPTGISATNTITVNGNGCTLTFSATTAALPHTLMLSGADYMTFYNLNVTGTGATYALTCHLWNGSNNNSFVNCVFTAPNVGTATTLVPFSISCTSVSPIATAANFSGSDNSVITCTMTGGDTGIAFAGHTNTLTPNLNNSVVDSRIVEFYSDGVYNVYCRSTRVKGNIIERPTRNATATSIHGIYFTTGSAANEMVEGNNIRNLFGGITGATAITYGIYQSIDATAGNENIFRNNVISDIKTSGSTYGIYLTGAAFSWAMHNTIVINDPTSTGGLVYGIYCTGPNQILRNNIIYINRGGTAAKYCIYTSTAATSLLCNNNVLDNYSSAGTVGIGYLGVNFASLANWQNTGNDLNSITADPMFTNVSAMNYVPTNTLINNFCPAIGVATDLTGFARSNVFPDPGAYEFYNTPCSSLAPANSIVTPAAGICPNTSITLTFANQFTNTGISFQWQSSSFPTTGFAAVAGATTNVLNTPTLNTTMYYNAILSCAGGGTILANTGQVFIAGTTTNNVPYSESFEGISRNNLLPNCSWSSSDPGIGNLTFTNTSANNRIAHTGNKFASFRNVSQGTNYFYTNGIYLNAGVTYSASLWYITEFTTAINWSDLSIMIGQTQTPTGLTSIVSSNGPASSATYKLLSNTFSVSASGIYYIAVAGTNDGQCCAEYLTFDDLHVSIPCSLNTPTITVTPSSVNMCSGQPYMLTANGANNYVWNTGATASAITITPNVNPAIYSVTGTRTLTGCSVTYTQSLNIKSSPSLFFYMYPPVVCSGAPANLIASGADTYVWSNNDTGPVSTVTPTSTSTYSLTGFNTNGCSTTISNELTVLSLPVVTAGNNGAIICDGQTAVLNGSGATTYQWTSNTSSFIQQGSSVNVMPSSNTTYTVVGTDNNGCTNSATTNLTVFTCVGLNSISGNPGSVKVYPNPTAGNLVIESGDLYDKAVTVSDLTGRVVLTLTATGDKTSLNISTLANGVYYVKIRSTNATDVIKIVKQ